jgi:tRNA and rRNA cytosine-C5-methylases
MDDFAALLETCTGDRKKCEDTEKALKKLLRRYQRMASENNFCHEERQASRKRLAELVIGTSVMRLRHFYIFAKKWQEDHSCLLLEHTHSKYSNEPEQVVLYIVQSMVDLHSQYMEQGGDVRDLGTFGIHFDNDLDRITYTYSLPRFLVKLLIEQYDAEKTESMVRVFNNPGPITIRRNRIKCPTDNILIDRLLDEDSVSSLPLLTIRTGTDSTVPGPNGCLMLVANDAWSPYKKSIWSLNAWKDGWFEVQDAGSQLIAEATEAKPGDFVIDYCAGNGGKTFSIASQMYEADSYGLGIRKGCIIAHDVDDNRLRQLKGSLARIGIHSNETSVAIHTTIDPGVELKDRSADVVLVDVPCSSTGVLRRRPSQRFQLKEVEITRSFPSVQLQILMQASKLVKNGGSLIYATCSISRYENEDVVMKFESQEGFDIFWEPWSFSTSEMTSTNHPEKSASKSNSHCRTLLPAHNGTDGFFIARWKRLC